MIKKGATPYIVFLLFAAAITLGSLAGYRQYLQKVDDPYLGTYPDNPAGNRQPLRIGDQVLEVEVQRTDAEHELGLSGRESLTDDQGMLFVFQVPYKPLFWMKDMRFPLDIIWIKNGIVHQVDERVPQPTKESPRIATVTPNAEIDMVLEVNAGWVSSRGIKVGDQVVLE